MMTPVPNLKTTPHPIPPSIFSLLSHPLHSRPSLSRTSPTPPLRCKTCSSVLNPHARVDFPALLWICPFCHQRNHFPHHYSSVSATNVPAELYPYFSTVNYLLPSHRDPAVSNQPQVFVFLLDTCLIEEELGFAKSAVKRAIGLLLDDALVGFVSFGTQVQVHELRFSDMSKVYVFRGEKEQGKDQVLEQLGLGNGGDGKEGRG